MLVASGENREKRFVAIGSPALRRVVEDRSPAKGHDRRELTDDEAIAGQKQRRLRQAQLRKSALARTQLLRIVHAHFSDGFGCVAMKVDARAVFERLGLAYQR